MGKTLVTGATGFLGTHLLDRLQERSGSDLRVLARSEEVALGERGVEIVQGSILSPESVEAASSSVERIFHLAGRVSREPDHARDLYDLHVVGTKHLLIAAIEAGVERIVLVSTSGTIAVTEDGRDIPDETGPRPVKLIGGWPYYTSKLYQEEEAERACKAGGGPELVIVHPSLLLGPGDDRLSSTEDVLKFLAGDIPVVPPGGINFVDVRDAAAAVEAAMERGRAGEHYLVGGPNWTMAYFFERLERLTKVKGPRLKLSNELYDWSSKALDAFYRQIDKAPPVDRIGAEMARRFWYCDSSKAERELGFEARDPYETLYDTVAYIKKQFLGEGVPTR